MASGIRDLLESIVGIVDTPRNPIIGTIQRSPQATNAPASFTGTPQNPMSFAGERVQPQLPAQQMMRRPQPTRQMNRQELMEMLFSNYQNRSMEGFNPKSRGFNSNNTGFRR